jgi:putative FmdB family regulatory protein
MTYEYVCTACHHEWEAEQSISAPPLKTCPNCSAEAAKRQISRGGGFILKGGGWYADGYGSSSSSSASSVTSESTDTKKTETPKTDSTSEKSTTTTDASKSTDKSPEKKSGASAAA